MKNIALSLIVLLFSIISALANDSLAEMNTGGLVFVYSPNVEMVSEELYVSTKEIRVDYIFRNNSEKDIRSIVAFPMPDITGDPYGEVAIPFPDEDNFLGFSVRINGQPVEVKLQQRVFALEIDQTDLLIEANIPLMPFALETTKRLELLPASSQDRQNDNQVTLDKLVFLGLVENEVWDDGSGVKNYPVPIWTLKSTYWWEMSFPANAEISVSHKYIPSVGGTTATFLINPDGSKGESYDEYVKRYCVDKTFISAVKRGFANNTSEYMAPFFENYISYILKTAQNWYGNIDNFRLVVDKGSTRNLVSFCGENVKKIGPTTFEMRVEDFYPENDLNILILVRNEE